jgi:hypothetical protein
MQSVLVAVLAGSERHGWINPKLCTVLIQMALDPRFQVTLRWFIDGRPIEYVRNQCVAAAREQGVDWLISLDNGIAPSCNPLDIIATAPDAVDIIGLGAGINLNGVNRWNIETSAKPAQIAGFQEVLRVGTGCLMMRSKVWSAIKGPWFKWVTANDELLSPEGGHGEDTHFCDLARENGFKLWTLGPAPAGHLRTCDLTELMLQQRAAR